MVATTDSDDETPSTVGVDPVAFDGVGSFAIEGGAWFVIYDRGVTDGWLRSDTVLSLEDER